jgi:DNA-binding GntR family transcriptional regulator
MDAVLEWLRNRILNDELVPGTQLFQEDVARQLGVSSTPVREAFGALEAEGFVERRPHRGVIVAERSDRDVAEVYELRAVIETLALRKLAGIKKPNFDGLEEALVEAQQALAVSDLRRLQRANSAFHIALVKAVGSPVLADIMENLVPKSHLFVTLGRPQMVRAQRDHGEVLGAIKRGDVEYANKLLTRHLHSFVGIARKAANNGGKPRTRRADR